MKYQHVPFELYEFQERAARETMRQYMEQFRSHVRAVDPEARVTEFGDEVFVECRAENKDRVLHMLTGGLIFDESHWMRSKKST